MGKAALYISNFTAGELSPRLAGRSDTKKYFSGCKTLENMFVHVHGGATRRTGTYFVREVKDSTKYVRVVPFIHSPTEAYVLELGDKYMRFYQNNATVMSGTIPYEVTTPWAHTDLFQLKTELVNGELYFVHPDYLPYKLHRYSDTNMSCAAVPFTTASGTVSYMPSTWVTGTYPAALSFYEERMFYANGPTIWGSYAQYPDDLTTGVLDADALTYETGASSILWMKSARKLMIGDYSGEWTLSSGSDDLSITPTRAKIRQDTNKGSYNLQGLKVGRAVLFIQRAGFKLRQIMYDFASDAFNADDISVMAEHMTRPHQIVDWDYQGEPDSIIYMVRDDGQLIGLTFDPSQEVYAWHRHKTGHQIMAATRYSEATFSGAFESVCCVPYVGGTETWDYPRDIPWFVIKRTVMSGTSTTQTTSKRYIEYMMPEMVDDIRFGFFVDSGLSHNDYVKIIGATNATPTALTTYTSHTWYPGYRVRIEEIAADSMSSLNNLFYTILSTPTSTTLTIDYDTTTASVYKTGSGGVIRKALSVATGLTHIAGEEVSVLVDGAVQVNKTVSTGGTITIDPEGCVIHAGKSYTSILEPMRVDGGAVDGTSQGKRKRIHDMMVRFYNTLGANIGSSSTKIDIIPFRRPSDPMDSPPTLFSDDKIFPFNGGWDTNGFIRITQEQPLPMTVLSISPRVEVND